jgi:hypothetical protein
MIRPMQQKDKDTEDHINAAWETLADSFADYSLPEVIAPSLAEYVLGLSIAGRHEDAAVWMPVAQLYDAGERAQHRGVAHGGVGHP